MISIEIAARIKPISLTMAFIPDVFRAFAIGSERYSIIPDIIDTNNIEINTVILSDTVFALSIKIIVVVMVPGPASRGMPKGTTAIFSKYSSSFSSFEVCFIPDIYA